MTLKKLLLVGDTHFGTRNDSPHMLDYSLGYFEKVVFPMLAGGEIDAMVHLGDLMDRRKYVNYSTLSAVRCRFLEPLRDINVPCVFIAGNHDVYYRTTNDINSLSELLGSRYPNIRIVQDSPARFDDMPNMLFVPWISQSNHKSCWEEVTTAPAGTYVFGHFELDGFEAIPGCRFFGEATTGSLRDLEVFSGHFHHRQVAQVGTGRVVYVGTPYDLAFSDRSLKKGVHTLDTETGAMEFIVNPAKMYVGLSYDGDREGSKLVDTATGRPVEEISSLAGKCVRLSVTSKGKDSSLFDVVCSSLSESCFSLSIMETPQGFAESSSSECAIDMTKGTMEMINDVVDGMEPGSIDKHRLKTLLAEIYTESLSRETTA